MKTKLILHNETNFLFRHFSLIMISKIRKNKWKPFYLAIKLSVYHLSLKIVFKFGCNTINFIFRQKLYF